MADVCVAEIDTLIDVSPADITTAADWLDKLQLGFNHAESWLLTATHQCTQISGEFGNSLNEYTKRPQKRMSGRFRSTSTHHRYYQLLARPGSLAKARHGWISRRRKGR